MSDLVKTKEKMCCSICKIPYERFTSKDIEQRHKKDSKFFGIEYVKGVLACPVHYKLNEGERWL